MNSKVPFVVDSGGFGGMCSALNVRFAAPAMCAVTAPGAWNPERSTRRYAVRATLDIVPASVTCGGSDATSCAFPCGRPVSTMFCT